MTSEEIRRRLARVLPGIENPGRYVGGEPGSFRKDPQGVRARWALVFPDTYELGMSNNALRVLQHVITSTDGLTAERAFLPWPDMATRMREADIPLHTLESFTPVVDFDLVGVTLQTELNYTNIPYLLELASIPVWAADRGSRHPYVVGGGPCMANPEPVALFFDAFVIGDGEILVRTLGHLVARAKEQNWSRNRVLSAMAELPGLYVPSLLSVRADARGQIVPRDLDGRGSHRSFRGVRRSWVERLEPADVPVGGPQPNVAIVHDRFAIELLRGCTQGCRFCQAGYWYRPVRELAPDAVIAIARRGLEATGIDELGLLSLSTADYSQITPLVDRLIEDPDFNHVALGLPSLRANRFGQNLARKAARARAGRTATFAPETGSERLRQLINKTITDQDMLDAAEGVFANGWHGIKLYTMIGLPTETLDDMEAFCELIERLSVIGRRHTPRAEIHPNVGILVPKPFTPMQWEPFVGRKEALERIRFVRERFRRHRHVRITWTSWETAWLEAVLARGDRRLAPMILAASRRGIVFESHEGRQGANFEGWRQIFEEAEFDPGPLVFEPRSTDEVFPWDFIHAGVTKGFLHLEWKRMRDDSAQPVPDCRWGACNRCGIPGDGLDTMLAPVAPGQTILPPPGTFASRVTDGPDADAPLRMDGWNSPDPASRSPRSGVDLRRTPSVGPQIQGERHWHLLLFAREGLVRFLPHQATMDLLERAVRRAGLRLARTRGFNPHPRLRNAGALPVGLAARSQELMVELDAPLDQDPFRIADRMSEFLPEGLSILSFIPWPHRNLPRHDAHAYLILARSLGENHLTPEEALTLAQTRAGSLDVVVTDHKGRTIRAFDEVIAVVPHGEGIVFTARTNASGNTASPYLLAAALLDRDPVDVRMWELVKLGRPTAGMPFGTS